MKTREKRSIIWKVFPEELEALVQNSKTFSDILTALGLRAAGGNHRTLKEVLKARGIDFSHIPEGLGANKGIHRGGYSLTSKEVLIQNCKHNRSSLRRVLKKEKLLPYLCNICGIGPEWNGKPMTLRIDHINGVYNDNRLENLQWVCPNCDSQLDTYCSKNKRGLG